MKKFLISMLSLMLITNLTACSENNASENEPVETRTIIEALPFPDIKLNIPEDYEVTSSEHIDEYYKKGNASIIVTSKPVPSDAQMNAVVDDAKYQYQNITDTFKEMSSEDCTVSGCDARIIEITYSIVGDENTMTKGSCIGFILGKNNLYIITCSAPMSEYADFSEEFKSIIKAARPLD